MMTMTYDEYDRSVEYSVKHSRRYRKMSRPEISDIEKAEEDGHIEDIMDYLIFVEYTGTYDGIHELDAGFRKRLSRVLYDHLEITD